MNEFIWTDELVKEFMQKPTWRFARLDLEIDDFKQSKQQSNKDWEIIETTSRDDIKKVKRLSDNSVWSLDEITNEGRITGFHILNSNVMMAEFENYLRSASLNLLQKAKQSLFTAEQKEEIISIIKDQQKINNAI